MVNTLWVRPAGFGQFLVSELGDCFEDLVMGYFNSDDVDAFRKAVMEEVRKDNFKYYDELDFSNIKVGSVTLEVDKNDDTVDTWVEDIEFILVKMSDNDLEDVGEFSGW